MLFNISHVYLPCVESLLLFPPKVFFAVLIGAFSIGQAGPSLEELGVAAGAMEFIYNTIHRVGGTRMGHQRDDHTHTEQISYELHCFAGPTH